MAWARSATVFATEGARSATFFATLGAASAAFLAISGALAAASVSAVAAVSARSLARFDIARTSSSKPIRLWAESGPTWRGGQTRQPDFRTAGPWA